MKWHQHQTQFLFASYAVFSFSKILSGAKCVDVDLSESASTHPPVSFDYNSCLNIVGKHTRLGFLVATFNVIQYRWQWQNRKHNIWHLFWKTRQFALVRKNNKKKTIGFDCYRFLCGQMLLAGGWFSVKSFACNKQTNNPTFDRYVCVREQIDLKQTEQIDKINMKR